MKVFENVGDLIAFLNTFDRTVPVRYTHPETFGPEVLQDSQFKINTMRDWTNMVDFDFLEISL